MKNQVSIFHDLIGQTFERIEVSSNKEVMIFHLSNGDCWRMEHHQDCCEHVRIEDICGELDDIVGCPIFVAEEVSQRVESKEEEEDWGFQESATWTFYKFGCVKGTVTIRWLGESNGYYSESVSFEKLDN